MKSRKTIIQVTQLLCICIIAGLISAYIIAKPIFLTQTEISYYTDIAEKVWFEGTNAIEEDDSIYIKLQLEDKKVQVLPIDLNKQSVTVDFSNSTESILVNEPVTSFAECFFFYGAFFGTIIRFIADRKKDT